MRGILIEVMCPHHGLERFVIKVKRKYNIMSSEIKPLFRRKPPHELNALLVGKYVEEREILRYVEEYFIQRGMYHRLILIKIV